jgi:hypothetical protein
MVASDPAGQMAFLRRFVGTNASMDEATGIDLERGRINLMAPEAAQRHLGDAQAGLAAFTVTVRDLKALALRLDEAGIAYRQDVSRILVPHGAAFGVTVEFQAA